MDFFQVPASLDFPYLLPHSLQWNESKIPMFITNLTSRCVFILIFLRNDTKKFLYHSSCPNYAWNLKNLGNQ